MLFIVLLAIENLLIFLGADAVFKQILINFAYPIKLLRSFNLNHQLSSNFTVNCALDI